MQVTAVDHDAGSGDVLGFVRREVRAQPSDLLLAMTRPKPAPTRPITFTSQTVPIANPIEIAPAKPPEVSAPVLSNVLRVDRHRFDRLSAHVGDLITYENAAKLQQQQLDRILQNINHRVQQFEKIQLMS